MTEEIREFKRQLLTLNITKAMGPDGINPKIIRILAQNTNFVNAVTLLYQSVAQTRCIPKSWKKVVIIALHKKGPVNDAGNYRPISLTCILCKVFEKTELSCPNLSKHQHGFVLGKSCFSNLLETVQEINRILENGDEVDLIYFDFQKAFDKVLHERLPLKLLPLICQ